MGRSVEEKYQNNLDIITLLPNASATVIRGGGHLLYRYSAPIVVCTARLDGCSENGEKNISGDVWSVDELCVPGGDGTS